MKKQAIFIYDPHGKGLVQVCDVRDLTPEQFEQYTKTAKEVTRKILCEEEKAQARKEKKLQEKFDALNKRIEKLENIICRIFGVDTYEEVEKFLNGTTTEENVGGLETFFVEEASEIEPEGENEHEQE